MHVNYDPQISYECVQCGRSCFNRWDIGVEDSVAQALKGHQLELRVIQERGQAFRQGDDGQRIIYKDSDHPRCGFLKEDLLCSIHSDLGFEAKPLTCQQYPYVFVQTPDRQIHASAVYSCTAVREEIGPTLQESRESIEDLIRRGARVHRLDGNIEVLPPFETSYAEIQAYEAELNRKLGEMPISAAFEEAILGLANAISSLGQPDQESVLLEEGLLASSWGRAKLVPAAARSQLQLIKTILSMGLLKPCLPSQDREVWQKIDAAVLGDADLEIPDFNWHAPLSELDLWINEGVGHRFDAQIKRFQSSLLFRKAHLTMGGLLPGLMLVWIMPTVIRLLTGLHAWMEQNEPGLNNFLWGLETAETHLVGHTFDTVPVYQRAAWQAVSISRAYQL
ncbi:MAG: YkgJ family cysteine cluster protein [Candidatus Eremiobacteraeota bacterium]|nr:YkgJ family cysteine cluster protein [Candidatus Eremiobacteraeota bacterium]